MKITRRGFIAAMVAAAAALGLPIVLEPEERRQPKRERGHRLSMGIVVDSVVLIHAKFPHSIYRRAIERTRFECEWKARELGWKEWNTTIERRYSSERDWTKFEVTLERVA